MNMACEPERAEKHISIHHAVTGISDLVGRIKALKYKISGPEPEEAPKLGGTESNPVMAEVLNATPPRIQDYVNQGINLIDEIDSALF